MSVAKNLLARALYAHWCETSGLHDDFPNWVKFDAGEPLNCVGLCRTDFEEDATLLFEAIDRHGLFMLIRLTHTNAETY